ncbi:MAG: hypothetical protein H7Z40_12455 [Phycisphaerae bacterium]|nr:hypothetical protein [Gemmatimonadaceae bacterium]
MTRFHDVAIGIRRSITCACLTAMLLPAGLSTAQGAAAAPSALTDAEFWELFATRSERGGQFASENFVSNEMTFQSVIPVLQRTLAPNGVYLGVGPEQNFTYIANLKPRLAIIFDIRRQNAMQHLMFKAIFELAPNRAEFVSRLFSRPYFPRTPAGPSPKALFDLVSAAVPNDSAYQANRKAIMTLLKSRHGFALAADDSALIEQVYATFYQAGPDINYGVRPGAARNTLSPVYPAFSEVQQAVTSDGVSMGFLATEENFLVVRDMHLRNLIVPVVGDFGGPSAIRAVGEYLRKRNLIVTAFYVSNVEQYLFRETGAADRFYASVSALPFDSTSKIIRSVPPGAGDVARFIRSPGSLPGMGAAPFGGSNFGGAGSYFISMTYSDSAGARVMRVTRDSAGVPVTRVLRDTTARSALPFGPGTISMSPPSAARDSAGLAQLRGARGSVDSLVSSMRSGAGTLTLGPAMLGARVRGANLLVGLAGIGETVEGFFAGRLKTYGSVIEMTKTSGWGPRVP